MGREKRGVSLTIDRVFGGTVGRINRRIGTDSEELRQMYNGMLTSLERDHQFGILERIRDGKLKFHEVHKYFKAGQLDLLPDSDTPRELVAAWERWYETCQKTPNAKGHSKNSLRDHRQTFAQVKRHATKRAQMTDWPKIVEALREEYADRPRSFNRMKSSIQAFLRDTVRKHHPLYQRVAGIPVLPWEANEDKRNPQTVEQLVAWEARLDEEVMKCLWSMSTTGMGPKEYWEDGWERGPGYIHIMGSKRRTRNRLVPDLGRCVKPPISWRLFIDRLRAQSHKALHPYDMRRSYAFWMELAGLRHSRQTLYMGHAATGQVLMGEGKKVGEIGKYQRSKSVEQIAGDTKVFREWLDREEAVARARHSGRPMAILVG